MSVSDKDDLQLTQTPIHRHEKYKDKMPLRNILSFGTTSKITKGAKSNKTKIMCTILI